MGNGYGLNGDYTNMLSCYQQALAIAEKIKDPLLIAKSTINMAIMYYSRVGQIDEALTLMEKAGNLFQSTGDSLDLIKSLQSRGNLWVDKKQYEKALQVFHRAAELLDGDWLVFLARAGGNHLAALRLFLCRIWNDNAACRLLPEGSILVPIGKNEIFSAHPVAKKCQKFSVYALAQALKQVLTRRYRQMFSKYYIELNMKTIDGFERFGCFELGSDRGFSLGLFAGLAGRPADDDLCIRQNH